MNKELIKKYKAEFAHWLNGGKLQAKFVNDPWEEAPEGIFSFTTINFILVIEDEYVELRKALAEGKTIQMYCKYDGVTPIWDDMTEVIKSIGFVMTKENYRIKPEEPKFKVGDWVRDLRDNSVFQINSVNFNLNLSITNGVYIHWQPKPGEWCWFYQSKREIPTLGNLKHFSDKDSFCAYSTPKASMSVKYFKHCEPFLGQLPTNLQDTK